MLKHKELKETLNQVFPQPVLYRWIKELKLMNNIIIGMPENISIILYVSIKLKSYFH